MLGINRKEKKRIKECLFLSNKHPSDVAGDPNIASVPQLIPLAAQPVIFNETGKTLADVEQKF